MKRPNDPLYSCNGKQAFSNWREANKALTRIRKYDDKTTPIHIYRCEFCPNFHLGGRHRKKR